MSRQELQQQASGAPSLAIGAGVCAGLVAHYGAGWAVGSSVLLGVAVCCGVPVALVGVALVLIAAAAVVWGRR